MKNKLIKLTTLLAVMAITGCSSTPSSSNADTSSGEPTSSSAEPVIVPVTNVKTGLNALNASKNYTADVSYNGTLYFSIYVKENYVGFDSETNQEALDFLVKNEEGIYPVNRANGNIISGEYKKKSEEENYLNLLSSYITLKI